MNERVHWSSVREDPCCPSEGPQVRSFLGHHTFLFQPLHVVICRNGDSFTRQVQSPYCVPSTVLWVLLLILNAALSLQPALGCVLLWSCTPSDSRDWEAIGLLHWGGLLHPSPFPFLGPVGKNPVLGVFFFFSFSSSPPLSPPPLPSPPPPFTIFNKQVSSMNYVPGFGLGAHTERLAGIIAHRGSWTVGGDGHKNKSLY